MYLQMSNNGPYQPTALIRASLVYNTTGDFWTAGVDIHRATVLYDTTGNFLTVAHVVYNTTGNC